MRPGVDVDAGLGPRLRAGAGGRLDDRRLAEERRLLGGGGELRGELAEGQVLAALADQAEGRDVPERGGAAVAEHHLVAVGQRRTATRRPRGPGPRGSSPAPAGATCRAASVPVAASASSASTRTLDGPAPKRPSAGCRSVGEGDRVGHGGSTSRRVGADLVVSVPPSLSSASTGHGRGHLMSGRPTARLRSRRPVPSPTRDAQALVERGAGGVRRCATAARTTRRWTTACSTRRAARSSSGHVDGVPRGDGRLAPAARRTRARGAARRRDQADVRRTRGPRAAGSRGRCSRTWRRPPGRPAPT